MPKLPQMVFEIRRLDALAYQQSGVHRLDPRAKLLTTLFYIIIILSFDKYTISALIPFSIFPIILIAVGNIPVRYIASRLLIVSPFVLFIGAANPIFDQQPMFILGSVSISSGWVSFASILLRFVLTVSCAIALIATTGFHGVCTALQRLGLPTVMVLQLLMLQRFVIVLTEEAVRMVNARALRSFQGRGLGVRVTASLIGHLLLRTVDRAQRIFTAMRARGFASQLHPISEPHFGSAETSFTLGFAALFVVLRFYDFPQIFGALFFRVTG